MAADSKLQTLLSGPPVSNADRRLEDMTRVELLEELNDPRSEEFRTVYEECIASAEAFESKGSASLTPKGILKISLAARMQQKSWVQALEQRIATYRMMLILHEGGMKLLRDELAKREA